MLVQSNTNLFSFYCNTFFFLGFFIGDSITRLFELHYDKEDGKDECIFYIEGIKNRRNLFLIKY